jgi:hypothetical protein
MSETQVFVKDFSQKTWVLRTDESETVDAFIERFLVLSKMPAIPLIDLRLLYKSRLMVGSELFSTYAVERDSTLMLIKLERGGAVRPWSEKPKTETLGIF